MLPLCECGCGGKVSKKRYRYIIGHHLKKPKIEYPCDNCDVILLLTENYIVSKEHHYCNRNCYDEWTLKHLKGKKRPEHSKAMSGKNHPFYGKRGKNASNWKEKIEYLCDNCGTILHLREKKINERKHHFCNRKCFDEWQTGRKQNHPDHSGKNNPAWVPKITVYCSHCNKPKQITKIYFKRGEDFFCNQECYHKWCTGRPNPKISESVKRNWQDPEFIKKTVEGHHFRPTSYEKKLMDLINKHSLPFKYVGDGSLWIGYPPANQDFIHENENIIIETYASYFKIRNNGSTKAYESQRYAHFAQYDFKTLFLDENDIKADNMEEICLEKIEEFINYLSG